MKNLMALRNLRYEEDEILRKKSREVPVVLVQALDENGNEQILTGQGELAKCFCHEIDHLDGIVLPGRVMEWIC